MERRQPRPITSNSTSENDFTKPTTRNNHFSQDKQQATVIETNLREYDADGYHVIELNAPHNHFMMKYNDTHMQIVSRREIIYDGPGYDEAKKAVESQLRLMDRAFTEVTFTSNFDSYLDWLDTEMDELERMIDDLDTRYLSYSHRNWDSAHTYSSRRYGTVSKKRNSGCLGCLFWTILFIVIISIVLYGMGQLGMTIVKWFTGLF